MIKVLFIEDDQEKLRKLVNAATTNTDLSINSIRQVTTSIEAKKLLQKEFFDIVFLDMAIPLRLDKAPQKDEGLKLLKEVCTRSSYKQPANIIGITSYSEIFDELSSELLKLHVRLYHFDPGCTECEEMIQERVRTILRAKHSAQEMPKKYESDLAIVCALNSPELSAVLNNGWKWEHHKIPLDNVTYYKATYINNEETKIAYAAHAPQMGMASAAILASKMITHFRPRFVAMPGIAGGFSTKTNYGDIVAPQIVWDGGCGKWHEDSHGTLCFQPEPYQYKLDPDIRGAIERLTSDPEFLWKIKQKSSGNKPDTELKLHKAPMATGAHVIATGQIRDQLLEQHRKVIAFDMEASAIAAASEESSHPKPRWVIVKSIVDFGDKDKGDDFQQYGASTSALFLTALAEYSF